MQYFLNYFSPNKLKIIKNIGWLLFDKISRLAGGLLVGIFIARFLGPQNFGLLSYAAAFSSLVGVYVSMGLDSIVVKELVLSPNRRDEILGTSFLIKLVSGSSAFTLSIFIISVLEPQNMLLLSLVALSSAGFIFQSFNVIDYYHQSLVKVKYTVWAQLTSFFIVIVIRIGLLLHEASVIFFAIAVAFDSLMIAIFLILVYRKFSHLSVYSWKYSWFWTKKLLGQSWPLIFAGIASMINMRLDQVMLGAIVNEKAVGIYAVAIRVSELWFLIPMFLGMSIFPSIVSEREKNFDLFKNRLHKIVLLMALFAIPFALVIVINSNLIIDILFGKDYVGAGQVLAIHIWSGLPYVITFAYGQAYYTENITYLTIYPAIMTVLFNIILNTSWIPIYGVIGAASASSISAYVGFIISMTLLYRHTKIFRRDRSKC